MRKSIQTPLGTIKLEYDGSDIYRAPIPWFPNQEYIVFHDRQQTQFEVVLKRGKRGNVIGLGKDLAEACDIIQENAKKWS